MQFIENEDLVVENKEKVIANFKEVERASEELFMYIDSMLDESSRELYGCQIHICFPFYRP